MGLLKIERRKKHTLSSETFLGVYSIDLDSASIGLILSALSLMIQNPNTEKEVKKAALIIFNSLLAYLEGSDPKFIKQLMRKAKKFV